MSALIKATAAALLLTGATCIGSFATDLTRRELVQPAQPGMASAARATMASVASLEITAGDGQSSFAAAFVYRADGLLLTAAHAVDKGMGIVAVMADGQRLPATVVGRDGLSDIAVLRVTPARPLMPLTFSSSSPEQGEAVAAIGNPLGYGRSITAGIVSATARAYGNTVPYDFIQHDAALNPGSSGGPLVNRDGAVIGMNVAIADGSRHNIGIGLAVPANIVQRIADVLIREGVISRPVLGLRLRDVRGLVQGEAHGVVIEQVDAGSPAEKAGLRAGMVITRAGPFAVAAPRDLARALEPLQPGAKLEVVTGSQTHQLELTPPRKTAQLTRGIVIKTAVGAAISLAPGSVRIETIAADSAAERAGLLPGDMVLAVGTTRVDGGSVETALRAADPNRLPLLIQRQAISRYVVIGDDGRLDTQAPFGSNAEALDSATL